MPSFTIRTELPRTTPEAFWAGMSIDAVNAELRPLARMGAPAAWRRCPLDQWTTGRVLFRSTIWLFGVLPVDSHSLRLEALYAGPRGFLEDSETLWNRRWRHERTTAATAAGGLLVEDRVTVESRLPGMAALMMPVYRFVFRHRHRRLRAMHGGGADG